jgi:hypothetical protein
MLFHFEAAQFALPALSTEGLARRENQPRAKSRSEVFDLSEN